MTNILEQLYNDCLENDENGFDRYVAVVPVFYLRAVSAYSRQIGFDLKKLPVGTMRDEIDAMISEGLNSIMPDNVVSLPDLLERLDTLNGHLASANMLTEDTQAILNYGLISQEDGTGLTDAVMQVGGSGGAWDDAEIADLISTLAAILAAL